MRFRGAVAGVLPSTRFMPFSLGAPGKSWANVKCEAPHMCYVVAAGLQPPSPEESSSGRPVQTSQPVTNPPARPHSPLMKEQLEELEQFAIDVILDRRRGTRAGASCASCSAGCRASTAPSSGSDCSSTATASCARTTSAASSSAIGNLTVGGTGKTPVVEKFARSLTEGGRRVAILSRGYKSVKPPVSQRIKSRINGKTIHSPPRVVTDGEAHLAGFQRPPATSRSCSRLEPR